MSKERPIIFSGPMVNAILRGEKTQTRRIINHPGNMPHFDRLLCDWALSGDPHQWDGKEYIRRWQGMGLKPPPPKVGDWIWEIQSDVDDTVTLPVPCPYGDVGDRLWVREVWKSHGREGRTCPYPAIYRAEYTYEKVGKALGPWKSPIHMPRWASRIDLEITARTAARLHDITEEDAQAEGINGHEALVGQVANPYVTSYADYWDALNGKRYPWESNPWVWVLTLRRIEA